MNQGSESGIGDIPVSAHPIFHCDGFVRAYPGAESATFTGNGIDPEILDCAKAADILALATLRAFIRIDLRDLSAPNSFCVRQA
jgi:hypothetical protein